MALIGDSCVRCGSSERQCGDPVSVQPVVMFTEDAARAMLRVRVELSAEGSYSEDVEDVLYFQWEIVTRPQDDTQTREPVHDGGPVAGFMTEHVGLYVVRVTAVGANGGCSSPKTMVIASFRTLSPLYEGTALDTSWVWQLLPDFWSKMNQEARHKTELVWRGLTQLLGSDLTRAFDLDTSKSIYDIQDTRIVRWARFPLDILVEDSAWYLHASRSASVAAVNGRSVTLDRTLSAQSSTAALTQCRILSPSVIAVFPSAIFTPTTLDKGASVVISIAGRQFTGSIAHVSQQDGQATEYIIDDVPLPTDVSSLVPLSIAYPPPVSPLLHVSLNGRGATGRAAGALLTLDTSYARTGDTVRVYPALHVPDAQRVGVTPGDGVQVTLRDSVSSRAVNISLEVAAVSEDGVLVKPVGTLAFTDILDVIAYTFAPRGVEARDELKTKLLGFVRNTLPRVEGRRVTSASSLSVRVFGEVVTLNITGARIKRRHALQVDGQVRSLGVLREFTEPQRVTASGRVRLTDSRRAVDMGRPVIDLVEGTGFRLVTEPRAAAPASGLSGENKITCPVQHVLKGDALVIQAGIGAGTYKVVDVFEDGVRVTPPVERSFTGAVALIVSGGVAGSSARVEFTPPLPPNAPETLWSEGAIYTSPFVERRFGSIVGLTRAAWEARLSRASYLDAVRALYHARMGNQTPYAVARTVAVLLGLPYTPRRAIVRRIDDIGGALRVLLEDMDERGSALGSFQVHDIVTQDEDSLAADTGLIDAADGSPLRVGSEIEPMTVLSRGVSVVDSVDARETAVDLRHTFAINVTASRVQLTRDTARLLKLAARASRPAYTKVTPRLKSAHSDTIRIDTSLRLRARKRLFDTAYGLFGPAEIVDDELPGIGRVDLPSFVTLTTWFPVDGHITLVAGEMRLTSASGGLLNPPSSFTRFGQVFYTRYTTAWVREGDVVQLRGRAHGPLYVDRVISDTEIALRGDVILVSGAAFQISRHMTRDVAAFSVTTPGGAFSIPLPQDADARGISRGDEVVFPGLAASRYRVQRLVRSPSGDRIDLQTRGYTPLPAEAVAGDRDVHIRAPRLAAREMVVRLRVSNDTIIAPRYALEPGDVVHLTGSDRTITGVSANQSTYFINRNTPDTDEQDVRVTRPLGVNVPDGRDSSELGVRSSVTIVVRFPGTLAPSALSEAGGLTRVLKSKLRPLRVERGDVIHVGGDSIDTGEGVGSWRAVDTTSAHVILNRPFTPLQGRITIAWARQAPLHQADWRE